MSAAVTLDPLLRKLKGGDRRSIGRVDEVVAAVREGERRFGVLVDGLTAEDPLVRCRRGSPRCAAAGGGS